MIFKFYRQSTYVSMYIGTRKTNFLYKTDKLNLTRFFLNKFKYNFTI